jgi:hypothetical protein
MRKFWVIAALNILVLGGISAPAIMAILGGHALSGIGAPDVWTWGLASVGPLALLVVAVLAVRLHQRGDAEAAAVDPAIAADLPGSNPVNVDEAAKSRLSRFARPSDLGDDTDSAEAHPSEAADDTGPIETVSEYDLLDGERTEALAEHEHEHEQAAAQDFAADAGNGDEGFAVWQDEIVEHDVASEQLMADHGDIDRDGPETIAAEWPEDQFAAHEPATEIASVEPAGFRAEELEIHGDEGELPPIANWLDSEKSPELQSDDPFHAIDTAAEQGQESLGMGGLPFSRLSFAMPAEKSAAQWDWIYVDGAYHVAPAAQTGFPWATAGIAHVAGAITASRLLPAGSQASAEARAWREAVVGFERSEPIDLADCEAFVGWINSLDTGDDAALRAAVDEALEALKAEAHGDHALAASLPHEFGTENGGEAGGIALAG